MISRRQLLRGTAGSAGVAAVLAVEGTAEARETKTMPDNALGLLFDGTRCIGCRACIAACKESNGMPAERTLLEMGNYWESPLDISGKTLNVIKVYKDGTATLKDEVKDGFAFTKVSCMQCVDPSCVSACPVTAMHKDPENGIIHYDLDACVGCRYCVEACPFGVPRFTYDTPTPKISKCQLCSHRYKDGKYAACAEVCPTGATLFGPVKELKAEVARRKALTPGENAVFPRGRIGGTDSYVGVVHKYVDHVYGDKEIGGTQVLHLSGVPFELLNKPALPEVAPAKVAERLQHAIYYGLIAPVTFLGGLVALAFRNMRSKSNEPPTQGGAT